MAKLSPIFNEQVLDENGVPASGWKLNTYQAGSSTRQATYADSAGTVLQANPIILQTDGRPASPIWLSAGQSYKFVLTDADDVLQWSADNISGINDTSVFVSQWIASGVTPTYISTTQFSLIGDQTSEFHVGRRLQFSVNAGAVYGVITASAYTTLTTVTVALDSGVLDSGLSAVNLSILRADNSPLPKRDYEVAKLTASGPINMAAPVSIASAASIDLGAAASNNVTITGTTGISSLGTATAGIQRTVTFAASLLLTYNATSLILPASANITTQAGDTATFVSLGSGNWRCLSYQQADGRSVNRPTSLSTASGSAPSYSARAWGQVLNSGTVSLGGSGNVASVARNAVGDVTVTFTTAMPNANYAVSLTGANASIPAGDRTAFIKDGSKSSAGFTVYTVYDGAPTAGVDCNFDFVVFC